MRRIVQGSSKKCHFGCIYCFTRENFQTNGRHELDDNELNSIDIIQPFSDYDVFACENCNWEEEIILFTKYKKIISFATKAHITEQMAMKLSSINKQLQLQGAFLHVGVSITNIKYISEVEPKTPSLEIRLESLKNLYNYNIPCSVIIRPILPLLDDEDIFQIISSTYQYCNNYVYGPLYANSAIDKFLSDKGYKGKKEMHRVNWRNGSPYCEIYQSNEIETKIIKCCESYKKSAYSSNVEAVEDIKNNLNLHV